MEKEIITILTPKNEFSLEQQTQLSSLGQVQYTKSRAELSLDELIKFSKDTTILAFDPDNLGGFEKSERNLTKLIDALPQLKGIALDTTAFNYIDLDYCRKRKIIVTNVPHYSSESVAEHVIALLLGCAKRIFISDRNYQKNQFQLTMGMEVKGKTLGIIGLGNIGQKVAELANGLGMEVIAYNRTPKKVVGIKMQTLSQVITQSDFISLNLALNDQTRGIINQKLISKFKPGVIIVNTADRSLVDEKALIKALKNKQVDSYALEIDDPASSELNKLENVFLFKGFGWYTKEALERNKEIWIKNIIGIAQRKPVNPVTV